MIVNGDCLEILPTLEASSVDTIITDPPYGLEFMGKDWDKGVPGEAYWRECLRVAKPGALLLAFGGTRTFHRLACAIEDAGWELRDTMMWLYGSGFPKSLDISKAIDKEAGAERADLGTSPNWRESKRDREKDGRMEVRGENAGRLTAPATEAAKTWDGYGTALKPAWEPIVVAMKPCEGTFAQNAQAWGVAGFHIDGGRIGTEDDLSGGVMSGSTAEAWDRPYKHDGETKERVRAEWTQPPGRFPANLLLDEEAAAALDEQSGTLTTGAKKAGTMRAAQDEPGSVCYGTYGGPAFTKDEPMNSGGGSRFFYTAKASSKDRVEGNTHPTVKPLALMRYLCRITRPPHGGTVLDPFMGSGSTLLAAQEEGRKAIGIELDHRWCQVAKKRTSQQTLF